MILECPGQAPEQEELRFCSRHGGAGQNTETGSAKSGDLLEWWFIRAAASVDTVGTAATPTQAYNWERATAYKARGPANGRAPRSCAAGYRGNPGATLAGAGGVGACVAPPPPLPSAARISKSNSSPPPPAAAAAGAPICRWCART